MVVVTINQVVTVDFVFVDRIELMPSKQILKDTDADGFGRGGVNGFGGDFVVEEQIGVARVDGIVISGDVVITGHHIEAGAGDVAFVAILRFEHFGGTIPGDVEGFATVISGNHDGAVDGKFDPGVIGDGIHLHEAIAVVAMGGGVYVGVRRDEVVEVATGTRNLDLGAAVFAKTTGFGPDVFAVGAFVIAMVIPSFPISGHDPTVAVEHMLVGIVLGGGGGTVLVIGDGVGGGVIGAIDRSRSGGKLPIAVGDFIGLPNGAARIIGMVLLSVFENRFQGFEQIVALEGFAIEILIVGTNIRF